MIAAEDEGLSMSAADDDDPTAVFGSLTASELANVPSKYHCKVPLRDLTVPPANG